MEFITFFQGHATCRQTVAVSFNKVPVNRILTCLKREQRCKITFRYVYFSIIKMYFSGYPGPSLRTSYEVCVGPIAVIKYRIEGLSEVC